MKFGAVLAAGDSKQASAVAMPVTGLFLFGRKYSKVTIYYLTRIMTFLQLPGSQCK